MTTTDDFAFPTELDDGFSYGQPGQPMWLSPPFFDGAVPMAPRRPELTGDGTDNLMEDIGCWVQWLVPTYRIQTLVPPCWLEHPALVEELMSLFYLWQLAWLTATDPAHPIGFHREFDQALSRIERRWKVPCDTTRHVEPTRVRLHADRDHGWPSWWSNPNFGALDGDSEHPTNP